MWPVSEKNRAGESRRYKILPWLISKSSQRKAMPSNKSRIISDPLRTWWDSASLWRHTLRLPSLCIQTVQSSGRMEATDIEGRDSKGDIRNFLYQLPKGRMHWPLYTPQALIELSKFCTSQTWRPESPTLPYQRRRSQILLYITDMLTSCVVLE